MESSERTNYEHVSSNGDVYLGNCKGMLPQGNGKYTWSDGTVYEGQWEGGKINGKGKVIWPSGAIYEGDFLSNYLHDFGTYSTPDGSVYTGSWRFNIQEGIGKKQYYNSDVYEGSWKEGVREGIGRYIWSNGNMYVGVWKSGKMCGRGVMKWSSGEVFDGIWLNGCIHGSGFYKSADGSYYFGTWTKGLKDGWGTFYPAGSKSPSMKKWCSFALHKDKRQGSDFRSQMNLEEQRTSKRGIITKHSFSQRISSSKIFRRSGHILSRKSILMEQDLNLMDSARKIASCDMACVLSSNSVRGQHEMESKFEREYIQGILMKERVMESVGPHTKLSERRCKAKEANKKSHSSYYLMLNLQLGIRYSVGKSSRVPMSEALSSDFEKQARVQVYFPKRGSQLTPPHKSLDFVWMDYCPMVFRNLREMFKLDTAEYMMSICGHDGLRELSSPGKSGSIFYRSHDDRFVIKTLKRSELKVLLNMLPSYYDHVMEHENTLVTKFFGVHQIAWKAGKKVRFVVTGNIFCTELRIHRSYDLKGSYQGRITSKDKMSKNTTLKDRDLSYEFQMDRLLHESLFKQLSIDSMFLESQQILDYSLLLGLHFRAPEHLKALLAPAGSSHDESISTANASSNLQHELLNPPKGLILVTHEPNIVSTRPGPHIRGNALRAHMLGHKEADLLLPGTGRLRIQLGVNMPAQANHKPLQDNVDSAEVELFDACDMVLYLGIIDILQEYNLKKKLENAYKSLRFDPMSISAIKPKLYSRRFIHFLQSKFHVEL